MSIKKKKLETLPSCGDSVLLEWATTSPCTNGWGCVLHLVSLQASLNLIQDILDIVLAMDQKEGKLFTWMSSVWDSSSKPRMKQGNCQQHRRSAWMTTALLLQAFLQQDNTKQFLPALQCPKLLRLCGNATSAKTKICFWVFKITWSHVTVRPGCRSWSSSFLQPCASVLWDGIVGKARGAATSLCGHSQTKTVAEPKLEVLTSAFLTWRKRLV